MNITNLPYLQEDSAKTYYNIIFTVGSVPPVMAAMLSIKNNHETWAAIQRGKTYSGIDNIDNFFNAGFSPDININENFTQQHFDAVADKMRELNQNTENSFFNIYVQDATALFGAALAANAGISRDNFHVFIIEDGVGTYKALKSSYTETGYDDIIPAVYQKKYGNTEKAAKISHRKQLSTLSDKIYAVTKREYFSEKAATFIHNKIFPLNKLPELRKEFAYACFLNKYNHVLKLFNRIMSKTDNRLDDDDLTFDFGKSFAVAALDNFSIILQDPSEFTNIVQRTNCKELINCFCNTSNNSLSQPHPHIQFININELFFSMDQDMQRKYLTLIFGNSYNSVYNTLTRTTRNGQSAPHKKLIYFQQRLVHQPRFISAPDSSIGGLSANETVPPSYSMLDEKYRNSLLFGCENDYRVFLDAVSDMQLYPDDIPTDILEKTKVSVFNRYTDYIFQLKLMYSIYGKEYDFILKGHPSEPIGIPECWHPDVYRVKGYSSAPNNAFNYSRILDNAICSFHKYDSVGQYIGYIPYTICAENISYLDVDYALGGHPTSSYASFGSDADILFVISRDDGNITNSINLNHYSTLSSLYKKGLLCHKDKNGNVCPSIYYNTGNIFKAAFNAMTEKNDPAAQQYRNLFTQWLGVHHSNSADIDNFGFAVR